MQLEVGKKYKNRLGEIVEIANRGNNLIYPFEDTKGYIYTNEGCLWSYKTSSGDLIEEYIEFKVGDDVEVVSYTTDDDRPMTLGTSYIGTTGKIVSIDFERRYPIEIQIAKDHFIYLPIRDIRLMSQNTLEEDLKKAFAKVAEIKAKLDAIPKKVSVEMYVDKFPKPDKDACYIEDFMGIFDWSHRCCSEAPMKVKITIEEIK